jgi:hypothetical protein
MTAIQFFLLSSMIFLAPALPRWASVCVAAGQLIFACLLRWDVV